MIDTKEIVKLMRLIKKMSVNQKKTLIRTFAKYDEDNFVLAEYVKYELPKQAYEKIYSTQKYSDSQLFHTFKQCTDLIIDKLIEGD